MMTENVWRMNVVGEIISVSPDNHVLHGSNSDTSDTDIIMMDPDILVPSCKA